MPRWFHRNYLWLTGVACGIIIFRKLAAFYPALFLVLLLTVWLGGKKSFRNLTILLIALAVGSGAGIHCRYLKDKTPVRKQFCNNLTVRVNDHGAIGPVLNKDDKFPAQVRVKTADGLNFMLQIPFDMSDPDLSDGELWQVSGSIYPLEMPAEFFMYKGSGEWEDVSASWNRSSYNDYLILNNISGRIKADSLQKISTDKSALMPGLRRKAAARLDAGITDADNRALLGAVILGLRSRLSSSMKQQFARVGVAHLFSVSGLHVGVMAVLILLVLRPLPLAWHWLSISTLVIYVAFTGGNAPAIRAFCMLAILILCKSRLQWIRSLELLSLIAAVLLVINPYYITDAGFQYSFIVTAMLIKASVPAGNLVRAAGTCALWWGEIPGWKKWMYKRRGELAGTLFYAATAFLTSSVLVLYHQQMFFGGSMLVNLLILPVLTPLFMSGILKCLLPWVDGLWNILLNAMADYIQWVVRFFDSFTGASELAVPHYLWILLVLVMLWLLLDMLGTRYALYPAAGLLLAIGFLFAQPVIGSRTMITVISGGALEEPLRAVLQPEEHNMYIANAGRDGVYLLSDIAGRYGIRNAVRVEFSRPVGDCVDGLGYLQKKYIVEKYTYGGQSIRSRVFRRYTSNIKMEKDPEAGALKVPGIMESGCRLITLEDGSYQLSAGKVNLVLKRTAFPRVYMIPAEYCK